VSEDEDDDCIPRGGGEDGGEVGLPATEAASLADALATARSLPPSRRSSREVRPRPRHSPTPSPSTSRDKAPSAPPRVTAPLRVAPEDPQTCRLSDDLADSCKTLCKVCGQPFFLTGMRSHTQTAHGIQITRYKEIYGPFDIIEKVFHKCHICGKILLLDSDAMGGHIKGTHKMKEKEYKEKYCTYTRPSTNLKYSNSLKSNVSQKSLKPEKSTKSLPPVKALKASKSLKSVKSNKSLKSRESETEEEESDEDQEWLQRKKRRKVRAFDPFKDVEYDCAMPHCEPCGRSSVVVHLASLDNQELEEAVVQQEMEPSAEEAEKQQDRIEPNPELLEEGRETKEKPLCTKSMPRLIRACLAAEVLEPTFSSTDSEEGSMDVSGESSIDIDTSTDMGDSEEDEEKVVDDARKKMEEGEEESMKVKASDVDAEENVMDYHVEEPKDNTEEVELEENCGEVKIGEDVSCDLEEKWGKEHGDHDGRQNKGGHQEEELMRNGEHEISYIDIMDEILVNVQTSE